MEWLRAVCVTRAEPESIEAGVVPRQRNLSAQILVLTALLWNTGRGGSLLA